MFIFISYYQFFILLNYAIIEIISQIMFIIFQLEQYFFYSNTIYQVRIYLYGLYNVLNFKMSKVSYLIIVTRF